MPDPYVAAEYARLILAFHKLNYPHNTLHEPNILSNIQDAYSPVLLRTLEPFMDDMLAEEPSRSPAFWRFAYYVNNNSRELLSFSLHSAPSLSEAIKIAIKYQTLISNFTHFCCYPCKGGQIQLESHIKGAVTPYKELIFQTLILSGCMNYLELTVGKKVVDINVPEGTTFSTAIRCIFEIIGDTEIFESEGKIVSIISRQQLLEKNPDSQERLVETLTTELDAKLSEAPHGDSWADLIYAYLRPRLERDHSLDAICGHFLSSRRTLSRQLQKEGTSFKKILNTARKDCAMTLINQAAIPIKKVASKSGFRSMSTFSVTFKHWTGESPRSYREKLLQE